MSAPPGQQIPEPTDDELSLEIHSPEEECNNLRGFVNYMKKDQTNITKKRVYML
jgi:hypothetical protein